MKFLLDTDICIYLIRRKPRTVLDRLRRCKAGDVGISAISVAELRYGAAKSRQVQGNQAAVDLFLAPLEIAAFDDRAAEAYGEIRAQLEAKGTPIGPLDLLIAAHAKGLGITLVTNNVREFDRVRGLKVERWV
ncbi:MAG TPA: type II toxin-antitoxin system VapC family toxin [Acidiferrobacterales bacterium]|jgi:tRNA(fMet)-specific endonuclease VapC